MLTCPGQDGEKQGSHSNVLPLDAHSGSGAEASKTAVGPEQGTCDTKEGSTF